MSWNEIIVTPENIREGTSGCSQDCAISLAISDSLGLDEREQVSVGGFNSIFKTFEVGGAYHDVNYIVHPKDKQGVKDFIDWFDEQLDYEDLSQEDDETLECHTLTFRLKEDL